MILLVDCYNVAYAAYYALSGQLKDTPAFVAATFGFLRVLIARLEARPFTHSVFLCMDDHTQPNFRKALYPAYKENRKSDDPKTQRTRVAIREALNSIRTVCGVMPVFIAQAPGAEADDIIAKICLEYKDHNKEIISGDKDLLQLVDDHTQVYMSTRKGAAKIVTQRNWGDMISAKDSKKTKIPIPRDEWLNFRMLVGDSSDNIKGVPGIGEVTAAKVLSQFSMKEFQAEPATCAYKAGVKTYKSFGAKMNTQATRDILKRNKLLMDLKYGAGQIQDLNVETCAYNEADLAGYFTEMQFNSLLPKLGEVFGYLAKSRAATIGY